MPAYDVKHYNAESGMLHSQSVVYASDEKAAEEQALKTINESHGYDNTGGMSTPRFRVAVTEVE